MATSFSNQSDSPRNTAPIGALSRFARKQEPPRLVLEHCELCNTVIPEQHRHLLALPAHTVICSCNACFLLFGRDGSESHKSSKYRVIPTRYLAVTDSQVIDERWDELMIPVGMAYIFYNSEVGRAVAFYPSPAGATESLLNLECWQTFVESNTALRTLQPDVEALLVNRLRGAHEYTIVPIDACYQLVGLIRTLWRGLSGGEEVWKAIDAFFAEIRAKVSASLERSV